MELHITFSYFPYEIQSFRRQLSIFMLISLFTFKVLIKHCIIVQKKQWLDKCYRESSSSGQMVEMRIGAFKWGHTSTNDAERLERPKYVTTPEFINNIILDDSKMKVRELAETTSISTGSVDKILHDDLGMRKLTGKWVLHLLTIDQKRQRVRNSKSCLDLFNYNSTTTHQNWTNKQNNW